MISENAVLQEDKVRKFSANVSVDITTGTEF